MTPEIYRPYAAERIGAEWVEQTIVANQAECQAVASRLDVPAVLALECRFRLSREGTGEIVADGKLRARLLRVCVVSLDAFEGEFEHQFRVRFVPAGTEHDDFDPEQEDEIPYAGGLIDLGEAAVEELALSLEPYPRKPDAILPADVTDERASPFAALAPHRH